MSDTTTISLPRRLAKRLLPRTAKAWLYRAQDRAAALRREADRASARRRARFIEPGSVQPFGAHTIRVNDGDNYFNLYNDLLIKEVYQFHSDRPDPLVIDCGSNIGASVLYYKQLFPGARVVAFEPDPTIYPLLTDNIARNDLSKVTPIQAAVGGATGTLTFYSDGKYGSCLAEHAPVDRADWQRFDVPCVLLRDYLTEPVGFLKMNIEGAEHDALAAAVDRLHLVNEMVIEYHHLPGQKRTLHRILEMLDDQGFEYLINDLDPAVNGGSSPPFRLMPDSRYYLLIYARKRAAIYRSAA